MKHAIDHIKKFIAEQTVQLEQKQSAVAALRKSANEAQAEADAISATIAELNGVLLGLRRQSTESSAVTASIDKSSTEAKQADPPAPAAEKGKGRK